MSQVKVSGNASGTGILTIAAPNTNSDYTLTLPTNTGTILTTASSGLGKVLQVVNASYSAEASSSSSTFADTGLTATITPSSNTSKILVLVNQAGVYKDANNTYIRLKLLRNSSELIQFENLGVYTGSTNAVCIGTCATCYLDSPATTSATTYKTQFASGANKATVYVQTSPGGGIVNNSTITLMEIAT